MRYALPLVLTLAACQVAEEEVTMPSEDACGASALQDRIGTMLVDGEFDDSAEYVRILTPGSLMTMDLNTTRLNVWVDANGKIEKIACG